MKTLGCKVTDETYQRFIELGCPISDSLRDAVNLYLKYHDNNSTKEVSPPNTAVNPFNLDQTIDNKSIHTQHISEQYKKKKAHVLCQPSSTKQYHSELNKGNIKRLPEYNDVNQRVNPSKFYHDNYSKVKESLVIQTGLSNCHSNIFKRKKLKHQNLKNRR
jgi:hypothetical protein